MSDKILNQIRIMDLSRVLAGPWATQLLADYGAEIIKIENPVNGDSTRKWGPPWNKNDDRLIAYSTDGSHLPENFFISLPKPDILKSLKLVGWGNSKVEAKRNIVPTSFNIQSVPNPFNPGCLISFEILDKKKVKIDVFNANGHYLETINHQIFQKGNHQVYWQPQNFASGIYYIRISDKKNSQIHKVLYLK